MVTRTLRITAIAVALALCGSRMAAAQTHSQGFVVVTAGATVNQSPGGTVGGEGGYEFGAVPIGIVVEAGQLFDVNTPELTGRAERIATAGGVTATAQYKVTYFDAGIRVRVPGLGALRPYVTAGGGMARVTTETSFSATSTAIQVGADLTGNTTKPYLMVGAGLAWNAAPHLVIEGSYRYGRILASTSTSPNDTAVNTHRVQAGIGVRF